LINLKEDANLSQTFSETQLQDKNWQKKSFLFSDLLGQYGCDVRQHRAYEHLFSIRITRREVDLVQEET
jgi:hypothetical protein